jgi:hypothetical protein
MFGSITRDPIFFRSLMITKRLLDVNLCPVNLKQNV